MPKAIFVEASVAALAQFLGTEFKLSPKNPNSVLLLRELNLQMGTESKTFRIEKRNAQGQAIALVQQSVDGTGAPAASTAESVILKGEDIELMFAPGDQVAIITVGATAAMRAKLYLLEVDPSEFHLLV